MTLVGDAAHLISSFGSEGVNLTLADAVDLVEAFTSGKKWAAISAYEASVAERARSAAEGAVGGLTGHSQLRVPAPSWSTTVSAPPSDRSGQPAPGATLAFNGPPLPVGVCMALNDRGGRNSFRPLPQSLAPAIKPAARLAATPLGVFRKAMKARAASLCELFAETTATKVIVPAVSDGSSGTLFRPRLPAISLVSANPRRLLRQPRARLPRWAPSTPACHRPLRSVPAAGWPT